MRTRECFFAVVTVVFAIGCTAAQSTVVVHDPTKNAPEVKLTSTEQALFDAAMPAIKRHVSSEDCDSQTRDTAGVAHGAFTRAGARQTLIFYQYCQTGNGLGWVGLILIDGGKVIGSYIADSGWTIGIERVPDINANGLDEFTLSYGGGMHQGQGGVGVDLMEFVGSAPKGLGWYKAEEYADTQATSVWKLTAKPGKVPVFYKQKFFSGENEKYRARGGAVVTKLGAAYGKFEAVK